MKALSKILSIFLSLALVASFMPTFALTASADDTVAAVTEEKVYPTQLVENGNFSNGDTKLSSQWSSVDTTMELSDVSWCGTGGLKATPNTTGGTAKVVLTLEAKPNTVYMLDMATNHGWANITYYINDKAVSLTDTATNTVSTERVNTTQKSIQTSLFTAPADGKLEITFERVGGIFVIEHVFVSEYDAPVAAKLDFEKGNLSDNFLYNGSVDYITNTIVEEENGNHYLQITNTRTDDFTMSDVFYAATVPGKVYNVNFRVNTNSRNVIMYMANSIWNSSSTAISQLGLSNAYWYDNECNKWCAVTATFTATSYFTSFGFNLSTAATSFAIDDFSVSQNGTSSEIIGTELVENGNFSNGSTTLSSQWSGVDSTILMTDNGKYLGDYCIRVTRVGDSGDAKAQLTLKAKPNTKYMLHMSTSSGWNNISSYYINDKAVTLTDVTTGTEYTERSNTTAKNIQNSYFTAPADGNVVITFMRASGTMFEIDRVFVTEVGAESVVDTDFEDGTLGNSYVSNCNTTATTETVIEDTDGNRYLKISNANNNWEMGSVFYAATVPGKSYRVSFDIKTSSKWATLFFANDIWGNSASISSFAISNALLDSQLNKWTKLTTTFTATSEFTTFGFKLSELLSDFCIDNFKVDMSYTITATATDGGEVFGSADYIAGDSVTLNAVNYSGYDFAGWYKGDTLVCEDEIYSFTASEIAEYTAHFEASENLIANTGFETGSINWNNGYGPYLWDAATNWGRLSVTEDAHSGKYAVKFTEKEKDTETNDNGSLIEQTVTVEENTDYLLTFWVKFDGTDGKNANDDAAYKINIASGTAVHEEMNSADTEWTRYAVVFNSGDGTTANIEFSGTLSDYVIDDVKLVKSNGGLIADGGFENGEIIGWEYAEGVLALDTEKANGNYSVKMNDNWSNSTSLTVDVMADTTYELTFNVSREIASGANIKFSVASGVGEVLYSSTANELSVTEESGAFVTLKAIFRSGVDSVNITLNSGDGAIWIDDFSITEFTCTGDANLDGAVNAADIVRVKKNVAQTGQINNALAGDIDNNGKLNASDLSAIRLEFLEGSKKKSVVNRYEKIMSEDGMIYGINVPWFTKGAQGHNLSSGTLTGYSASFNYETAYNTLYNAKAIGFNSVNIWLFSGFEGIAFDENLNATGLKADFVENLTSILEIAEKLDVGLTFTIQPHFDGMSDPEYSGASAEVYAEYFQIVADSSKREAYMNNAVAPVIELISQYEGNIVSIIAYCEPELEYIGDYTKLVNTDAEATIVLMKNFVEEIRDISKASMPEVPVGITLCSYYNDSDYRDMETNGILDYIGYDYYSNDGSVPTIPVNGNTWLVECGVKNTDADYAQNIVNFFKNARTAGYKAVYYWSYDGDTKTGIVNFSDENRCSAVGAIYEYIRNMRIASGRLSEEELNTPVVLLDREYVVMLAPFEGVYYQIHRYDFQTGTWVYDGAEFGNNIVIGVYKPEISGYYRVSNIVSSSEIYSITAPYKY